MTTRPLAAIVALILAPRPGCRVLWRLVGADGADGADDVIDHPASVVWLPNEPNPDERGHLWRGVRGDRERTSANRGRRSLL